MLILIRSLTFATVKGIGALALGGVILWQLSEHSGPSEMRGLRACIGGQGGGDGRRRCVSG